MKKIYCFRDESGTLGDDFASIELAVMAAFDAAGQHNARMVVFGVHWNLGRPVEVWPGSDRQDVARQIAEIDGLPANALPGDGTAPRAA